jgi:hypothetical protein
LIDSPACFNTLVLLLTGPIPMILGSTPEAKFTNSSDRLKVQFFYHFFTHYKDKAAPSLICDELPAVTLPLASKTGLKPANASLWKFQVLHLYNVRLVSFYRSH